MECYGIPLFENKKNKIIDGMESDDIHSTSFIVYSPFYIE